MRVSEEYDQERGRSTMGVSECVKVLTDYHESACRIP